MREGAVAAVRWEPREAKSPPLHNSQGWGTRNSQECGTRQGPGHPSFAFSEGNCETRGNMKIKSALALVLVVGSVSFAAASSKISDESYRLLRQLVSYKNREINDLGTLNDYTLDCQNVSDEQLASKKCTERLTAMQSEDRDLQVKHDVLGQEIASHIRQHKDEEWLFLGLMLDDKEFSNFAH
jgi:hypothetical protein